MTRPAFIILLATLSLVVIAGCGRSHRYDSRLVLADSLMQANPDSALALVQAVDADSLSTEGDRAYHDLLLTQARYKCYITATSDSAINRALAYYRHHKGEREKLTRAYIYKGAVMEELNHPDSAMFYYKTAEAIADPKDYANLGYATLRIADLYRMYYADAETGFEKFKSALHFFTLTGNKRLQQNCLFNMGGYSAITKIENPDKYLLRSTQLALELNDSLEYFNCQELRCRQLIRRDSSLDEAKKIAMDCLYNYEQFINNDLLLDLAELYAKTGKTDSAQFFLDHVNESINTIDIGQIRTRKYMILSILALKSGDDAQSNLYNKLAHQIEDSINNNKEKHRIQQIENTNNSHQVNKFRQKIHGLKWLVFFLIIASLVTLILLVMNHYRKNRFFEAIIKELDQHKSNTQRNLPELVNIDKHEALLAQVEIKDSIIGHFVQNMVDFMQTTIDASEHDSITRIRERINDSINNITADEKFWTSLRAFLDNNHNNIITHIAQNPKITNKDLKFIELLCCGFNYIEISITMGYVPSYVCQKRNAIAQKLNLDISLQDYLNQAMNS